MITENYINTENYSLVKIRENQMSQIEINQDYSYVKLRLNKESEIMLSLSIPVIIKIRCSIALSPNTWAKLLQFNTWQDVLDKYDTWEELLNDTSIL